MTQIDLHLEIDAGLYRRLYMSEQHQSVAALNRRMKKDLHDAINRLDVYGMTQRILTEPANDGTVHLNHPVREAQHQLYRRQVRHYQVLFGGQWYRTHALALLEGRDVLVRLNDAGSRLLIYDEDDQYLCAASPHHWRGSPTTRRIITRLYRRYLTQMIMMLDAKDPAESDQNDDDDDESDLMFPDAH